MRDQVLGRMLVATALIHLVFAIWPTLDIAASRAFVQSDGSFWLAKSWFAEEVRMPIWFASVAVACGAAAMLCITLVRGKKVNTQWRLWAFITSTYVLGPGLLVNVLLKQNWGRARPVMVEDFGGTRLFTPPFEITGQCLSNCSFVSGEAASAAVMVVVLAVCFGPTVSKPWRVVMYFGLAGLFVLAAGMRVASGRHFLSDVVFAGLFMLIIARFMYRAFKVTPLSAPGLYSAIMADIFGRHGRASERPGQVALPAVALSTMMPCAAEIDAIATQAQALIATIPPI